jgi:hypothetical protein
MAYRDRGRIVNVTSKGVHKGGFTMDADPRWP